MPDPPFRFFEGLVPRLQAHHPLICLFVSEGLVFCSPDMSMHDRKLGYALPRILDVDINILGNGTSLYSSRSRLTI